MATRFARNNRARSFVKTRNKIVHARTYRRTKCRTKYASCATSTRDVKGPVDSAGCEYVYACPPQPPPPPRTTTTTSTQTCLYNVCVFTDETSPYISIRSMNGHCRRSGKHYGTACPICLQLFQNPETSTKTSRTPGLTNRSPTSIRSPVCGANSITVFRYWMAMRRY